MPLNRESPVKRSKIAAKGNAAIRASGQVHSFSPEKAREAAQKRWQNKRLADQKREAELGNDQ